MYDFKSQCCFFHKLFYSDTILWGLCASHAWSSSGFITFCRSCLHAIYEMETLRQRLLSPTLCMVSNQKYGWIEIHNFFSNSVWIVTFAEKCLRNTLILRNRASASNHWSDGRSFLFWPLALSAVVLNRSDFAFQEAKCDVWRHVLSRPPEEHHPFLLLHLLFCTSEHDEREGAPAIWEVEARDAAKQPATRRTVPTRMTWPHMSVAPRLRNAALVS